MIHSLNGELLLMEPNLAVIECGGVGYACRTTSYTLSQIAIGEKTKLFTYLHVREDAVELFGFCDTIELNCFKMLISVSGVGPKAALAILSELSPQGFALCVVSGDSKALTRANGIGAKIAGRIILELKDKLSKQDITITGEAYTVVGNVQTNAASEALTALMVLGFSNSQASKALAALDSSLPTSELVKQALKIINS